MAKLLLKQSLFGLDLFNRITSYLLKGRVRIGNKCRYTHIQLCPVTDSFVPFRQHELAQVGDRLYIFQCLGRVTNHKVELDRGPIARIDLVNRLKQLFGADRFVDDITHVLGGGFRCQGKPAMAGINQKVH